MKEELKNKIDLNSGLTSNEVNQRIKEEKVNYNNQPVTKSISEIIKSNVLTYFNFLNIFLSGAVIFAGIITNQLMYSLKNCLFVGVIFWNTVISTIQEIISKKTVDKLSVIASSKALVRRDSKEITIEMDKIVLDDILILKTGNQVLTDCIIRQGNVEVNESFITG